MGIKDVNRERGAIPLSIAKDFMARFQECALWIASSSRKKKGLAKESRHVDFLSGL